MLRKVKSRRLRSQSIHITLFTLMLVAGILAVPLRAAAVTASPTGTITGYVRDSSAQPIAGLQVYVTAAPCDEQWLGSAVTDATGQYTITGLAPGDVFVSTCPECDQLDYISYGCQGGVPVTVTAGQTHPVDFQLQPAGRIAGTVTDSQGNPVGNIHINAFNQSCGGGSWVFSVIADAQGNFTIYGAPEGEIFLSTCSECAGLHYINEWYGGARLSDCGSAASVTVSAGSPTAGVDFQLELGGTITGRVTDHNDAPIPNLQIEAIPGRCDYNNGLFGTQTDQNGDFTLAGVPAGDMYVQACATCTGQDYINEWYGGGSDCNQAQPVSVPLGASTGSIDFQLLPGATVTGRILDAAGNPIENVHVYAIDNTCDGAWLSGTNSDVDGYYTLGGLPPGDVFIHACPSCSGQIPPLNYVSQWYGGTLDCGQAQAVTLGTGATVQDIDFTLETGGSISGRVTDQTGAPVPNVPIDVKLSSACNGYWLNNTSTDNDGTYTIAILPAGEVYVSACGSCANTDLGDESYDNTPDCRFAKPVIVAAGQDTPDIDFTLANQGTQPILEAHISHNWITGQGFPADTDITLTVLENDGTDKATIGWQTNDQGMFYTWEIPDFQFDPPLAPGDTIEVSYVFNTDPTTVQMQAQNISASVDTDADTITGTVSDNDGRVIAGWINSPEWEENLYNFSTTVQTGGGFFVNLSPFDLHPGQHVQLSLYREPAEGSIGGITTYEPYNSIPTLGAMISHNWIQGNEFPPGADVTVRINGGANGNFDIQADGWGNFWLSLWDYGVDYQLQPGDMITAEYGNGQSVSMTLQTLVASADAEADKITGTAFGADGQPLEEGTVWVSISNDWGPEIFWAEATLSAGGTFTINLQPNFDLLPGHKLFLSLNTPDGSQTMVSVYNGVPAIGAMIDHNWMEGEDFPPGANIHVLINNGADADFWIDADADGDFWVDNNMFRAGYQLEAGHVISATIGDETTVMVIQDLTAEVDNDDDQITGSALVPGSGDALAGRLVEAEIFWDWNDDDEDPLAEATAVVEPDGTFTITFDPEFDLQLGQKVFLTLFDGPDGGYTGHETMIAPYNDIPSMEVAVKHVRHADGQSFTMFEFDGGDTPIDSISIEGPSGDLGLTKADFDVDPGEPNYYWLEVPGAPEIGVYVFTARSGNAVFEAADGQRVIRNLPIPAPDSGDFEPQAGAIIRSSTPVFRMQPISNPDDPRVPLYVRLTINDLQGNRVFATPRVRGAFSAAVPKDILQSGQSYEWRVRVTDSGGWKAVQNRSNSAWRTFTMADTLDHHAMPAVDTDGWGAVVFATGNSTNLSLEVKVIDHDGVAADGSSHQVEVILPGGQTIPMEFENSAGATAGHYSAYSYWDAYQNENIPEGLYTFRVIDPDGNEGLATDTLTINRLEPPDEASFTPSLKNPTPHRVSATFDNVRVNDQDYDNFDTYGSIQDLLDDGRWDGGCDGAIIDAGKLKVVNHDTVGSKSCGIEFSTPETIHSIQADITLLDVTDNRSKARINGYFFHSGMGNVYAQVELRNDGKVRWSVLEEYEDWTEYHVLDSGTLMTEVDVNQTVTVSIDWDEPTKTLTFTAGEATDSYTHDGPIFPLEDSINFKALSTRLYLNLPDTAPTFTWDPVADASRYRVRIYEDFGDQETVWRGYVGGNPANPSYTVPPGILKPDADYRYRIEARDSRTGFENDNVSKTPPSNRNNYRFTTLAEAEKPMIDLDYSGVQTWATQYGTNLDLWIKVHYAQGVPDSIGRVYVTLPDGTEQDLAYYAEYGGNTAFCGVYKATRSLQEPASGNYIFTVVYGDDKTETVNETLDANPIGYPEPTSLLPLNGTQLQGTGVHFDWEDVEGAAFYRVEIYDEAGSRVYAFATEQSEYILQPGFLREAARYTYRITTRREFFDDNVDNSSSSPGSSSARPAFMTAGWMPKPGDLNADNRVDLTDAVIALKAMADAPPATLNPDADVDGDGRIGMADAIFTVQSAAEIR